MSEFSFQNLSWFPPAPADFRAQCRTLAQSFDVARPNITALALRRLACHALDTTQLLQLGDVAIPLHGALSPLTPFRLGLIGNGTQILAARCLTSSALRYGVDLQCVVGDYDMAAQDAFSADSEINRSECDAVLLALDYRGLPFPSAGASLPDGEHKAELIVAHIDRIRAAIHRNSGAVCLVQTLAAPAEPLFGGLDRAVTGTPRNLVDQVNALLARGLAGSGDVLVDVAALAETVGLAQWHSPAQWNLAKLPFAEAFIPLYANCVARLVGALLGKSRRCLVLDLDNTLWGGVVGDDGLEGLAMAQGDATGEAFLSIQRLALALRARGVVLAVSSKNDDETARRVFREHPEMLLREDHIAVFQANWNDKASNIKAIAEELELGLDALVLLDDNPVERQLVRQLAPDVAVPELPSDPALYARTLALAGFFEAISLSDEDRNRADYYLANARRVALSEQSEDLLSYLASLDMEVTFQPFEPAAFARIAQLINKSNQFNLTSRRYTQPEIVQLVGDPNVYTLQVRLSDRFGDNGMISVVICRCENGHDWVIDTWLMSCRVLGRGVETMVLRELLSAAAERGIKLLRGVYRPSGRNGLVRDHYQRLGFTASPSSTADETHWVMESSTIVEPASMRVHRPDKILGAPTRQGIETAKSPTL